MDVDSHTQMFPTVEQLDQGEFDLTEIFDPDQMDAFIKLIWRRIVHAFVRATEKRNDVDVSTDNYIVVKEDAFFESLAFKIIDSKGFHSFVRTDDLIPWVDSEDPFCDNIINQVHYKLVCLKLLSMLSAGDIWYDHKLKAWQLKQSSVDQYNSHHPGSRRFKLDRRNLHGRVRGRTPVPASISFPKGSPVLASM